VSAWSSKKASTAATIVGVVVEEGVDGRDDRRRDLLHSQAAVAGAAHAEPGKRPRRGLHHGADTHEGASAEGGPQGLGDRVLAHVALFVLLGAAVSDVGGDGSPDDAVHHHVGVLGVDPYVHVSDLEDLTGLDAEPQARQRALPVCDGSGR
jgi:hypothetical protein